ncbi:MAG: NAD(P)H-dependent oxidoreductase subunit E [Chloroflexi bacterium]|nr:NAD(P)H-dependent oxidoreductase subunit E [Chloroflexota bacterium]
MPSPTRQAALTTPSEALRATIRRVLASQRGPTVTVLSSLLAVQDTLGYISPQAVAEVAEFTHASVNDVWGVASFYTNFRFAPPAQHTVEVCWGPSCHVVGALSLLKAVLEGLGRTGEGETSDGAITLKYNTCLGACAQAPVMKVDQQLVGRATPALASQWLRGLRREGPG